MPRPKGLVVVLVFSAVPPAPATMNNRLGLTGCGKRPDLDDVPKRDRAGAKAPLILLALSARLKSCPFKTGFFPRTANLYSLFPLSVPCSQFSFPPVEIFRN